MAGAVGFEPTPRVLETRLYGFAYHYSFHYLSDTNSLWSGVHLHLIISNLGGGLSTLYGLELFYSLGVTS